MTPPPHPDLEVGTTAADDANARPVGDIHAVGHGDHCRRRGGGGDNAPLLPVGRFDDHEFGHRGGAGDQSIWLTAPSETRTYY